MRAIVMLHDVGDSRSVLSVAPSELVGLTRAIRESGHSIVPLRQLIDEPARTDCIALTFDDGLASVAAVAAPLLRGEGVRPTLFVTTAFVGRDNRWPSQPTSAPIVSMMSWDDVRRLHGEGWGIEAHSCTHPDLTRLSDAELDRELTEPIAEITHHVGTAPEAFAYPYGLHDDRVVGAVSRHYGLAVTTRMAPLAPGPADVYRIPRIDAFYLRHPRVHERFGSAGFRLFVALRGGLRRLRRHPGEAR